jgi:hypothetical protein
MDLAAIVPNLRPNTRVCHIQRSCGYAMPAMQNSRIVTVGLRHGARQKVVLERRTNPERSRRACSPRVRATLLEREVGGRRETVAMMPHPLFNF